MSFRCLQPWLKIDAGRMASDFGQAPFALGHRLAGHPLFELPRLVELARRLPEAKVEYNAGNVPLTLDPKRTPRNGLSAEETVERIETCNSWMVLKNVELDAPYGALLEDCLHEVAAAGGPPVREMTDRESFVFVSSPNVLTPYHMDPEENFLLQLRGTKTIHVLPGKDRRVLSLEELERFHAGAHRNLVFRERYRAFARSFTLGPGEGVHVPVTSPHWVQNGPDVSISYSITFQTRAGLRRAHAHRANAALRRLGLEPAPVGASMLSDGAKHLVFRALERMKRGFAS